MRRMTPEQVEAMEITVGGDRRDLFPLGPPREIGASRLSSSRSRSRARKRREEQEGLKRVIGGLNYLYSNDKSPDQRGLHTVYD